MQRQIVRPSRRFLTAVTAAAVVALLVGALTAGANANDGSAKAVLRNAAGAKVGVVHFTQKDGAVLVKAKVEGLTAGFHGFHVHALGVCTPPFTSALGHYNPTSQTHRSHAGDMPVLLVNTDGTGEARFKTDRFSVAAVIGRAVIVHADADNYANIPARYHSHTEDILGPDSATLATGDAGARASCGVIVSSDD